jgi:transcription initiation factor TFIIIB Brf1 subunit/transcription initiation factor TFIIB
VTQTELAAVADVSPITIRKQRDRIRTEFGSGTPSGN